jgi:conjugal transfer pilus assembly protein TraW
MRKNIMFIIIILINSIPVAVWAKDLGEYGATYAIIEEDAIRHLKKAIAGFDMEKFKKSQIEKIRNYKPKDLVDLPVARADSVFKVDMTGTIPDDIVGINGEIIYPKGYRYNPMEYVFMRRILVFIDGRDEKQIQWYKKSPYTTDMRTMLLITDGSYREVKNKLKTMVYYANRKIIDRMGIKAVPSVAVQNKTELEVREYAIRKEEK